MVSSSWMLNWKPPSPSTRMVRPLPGADGDGDGHGEAVAHGAEAGGVEDALTGAGGAGEEEDLDAGAGGAGDELVGGEGFGADDLGEVVDGDLAGGLAMLVGDDAVADLPVGAAGVPDGVFCVVEGFQGAELA